MEYLWSWFLDHTFFSFIPQVITLPLSTVLHHRKRMVQPVVRNIPQQRLQTVLHSTKNILFRIISFLRYALYVINFLRAIPSYCASAREFMRKCTTPENKRAYKYLLGMAMQEPDLAIIFWASVTSQLYTVFMDCCAAVYHHSKFLVKYKALSPVFFWVEKRLFAAFRALTRYSLWESRARPVDLVTFWHDYKIRIIRRVKRRNWNALQILLYALHPATIYKTTCRFFGILAVWRWTSLDYLFHGRPPSNFGRDINLINGYVVEQCNEFSRHWLVLKFCPCSTWVANLQPNRTGWPLGPR